MYRLCDVYIPDLKYLLHAVIDGHLEFLQRLSEKKLQADEEVSL